MEKQGIFLHIREDIWPATGNLERKSAIGPWTPIRSGCAYERDLRLEASKSDPLVIDLRVFTIASDEEGHGVAVLLILGLRRNLWQRSAARPGSARRPSSIGGTGMRLRRHPSHLFDPQMRAAPGWKYSGFESRAKCLQQSLSIRLNNLAFARSFLERQGHMNDAAINSFSTAAFTLFVLLVGSSVRAEEMENSESRAFDRWSGFHVGAHVGSHNINTAGIFDGAEPGGTPDLRNIGDNGAHAGLQAGFDIQWESLVIGIEADASLGGFDRSYLTIQDGSATEAGLLSYPIVGDLDYLATIRGRIGFDAASLLDCHVLLFVTGGAAFTRFEMDVADGRSKVDFDAVGTVLGGGIEYGLTEQWSLRAEYLHFAFDEGLDIADVGASSVFDANDGNYLQLDDVETIRITLNYKLN